MKRMIIICALLIVKVDSFYLRGAEAAPADDPHSPKQAYLASLKREVVQKDGAVPQDGPVPHTWSAPKDRAAPDAWSVHVAYPRMDSETSWSSETFGRIVAFLMKVEYAKRAGKFFVVTPVSDDADRRDSDLIFLAPVGPWTQGQFEISVDAEERDDFSDWLTENHDPSLLYFVKPCTNYAYFDHVRDSMLLFPDEHGVSKTQFLQDYTTQLMSADAFEAYTASFAEDDMADPGPGALKDVRGWWGRGSRFAEPRVVDKTLRLNGLPMVIKFAPAEKQELSDLPEDRSRGLGYSKVGSWDAWLRGRTDAKIL
mmetsp:Transcript_36195/g.111030  ORF Transcript_36195/g.111030 Transcript_36195/m.111030 type:complete len:312 (-) Transcript_36195:94-1029(-)